MKLCLGYTDINVVRRLNDTRVYKSAQYLIFELDDNKAVKYDFANKTTIGIRGSPVKSLQSQLRGYRIGDIINACEDKNYGRYLMHVYNAENESGLITNIGTVLNRVDKYSNLEQFFSSGVRKVQLYGTKYNINNVPKALIRICRDKDIVLSSDLIELYFKNPDGYQWAMNTDFLSLDSKMKHDLLTYSKSVRNPEDNKYYRVGYVNDLIATYGYTMKALMRYINDLATYEALTGMKNLLTELTDYCRMMRALSPRFDRYPRHFLTTHRIAARNYDRMKHEFDEEAFKRRYNQDMECRIGDYIFIYPKSTQCVKEEAAEQNNCVASYISKVIDGECDILFMRNAESPNQSLVTIEVRNGKIVQARRKYNYEIREAESAAISLWNQRYQRLCKNKEMEEKQHAA